MPIAAQLHQKTTYTRGLWQFQESLADSSGNAFDLALVAGNERYVEIRPGLRALKLTSATKFNHATLETALKLTGDVTVLMLVLVDSLGDGAIVAYDNIGATEPDNVQYSVAFFGSDLQWFHEHGAAVAAVHLPERVPPLFQLAHLVARRKNTVVEFFLNGRRIGRPSAALPPPTGGTAASLWLGFEGNPCASCAVASLRIDSRALSENEIAAEYNRTLGPVYGEVDASGPAPRYATAFGGTDEYATAGNPATLQKERTDTLSLLVRFRTTASGTMVLAGKTSNAPALQGYSLFLDAGRPTLNLNNTVSGANLLSVRTDAAFNDGNWHDVLVTYDGTSAPAGVKIYVDGSDQALTTVSNTLSATIATAGAFVIGARLEPAAAAAFSGDIDEVGIWSSVVSQANAQAIAVAAASDARRSLHTVGPAASLVAYWEMGDGATFPTIPDSSINNNPATLTNMEIADIFEIAA